MGIFSGSKKHDSAKPSSSKEEDDGEWNMTMLITGVVITLILLVVAIIYLKSWFPRYFDKAVADTFTDVDMNNSGKIERVELYAAVLHLYLKLNRHLKVRAPSRENIFKLCDSVDVGEGGLDRDEFHKLAKVLSKQIMGRALIQTTLACLAPLAGGFMWQVATQGAELVVGSDPWIQLFPNFIVEHCPPSLPPNIMSSLLMLSLPFLFDFIDGYSVKSAETAAVELKKSS